MKRWLKWFVFCVFVGAAVGYVGMAALAWFALLSAVR